MKKAVRTASVIVVLGLAPGGICFCEATSPESSFVLTPLRSPFKVKFEPVSNPTGSGPVDLQFQVRSLLGCDKATVSVTSVDKLEYSGPRSWVAEFKDDSTYSTVFQVVIPPNDTSSIEIKVKGCGDRNQGPLYFVTTGDTVEVTPGNPRFHRPKPHSQPKSDEINKDTLSQEQLQTKYEVALDLRDSTHFNIAEKILGPIPESSKFHGHEGYYILQISLEKLFKLPEAGIEFEFTSPPPWAPEYSLPNDSVPDEEAETVYGIAPQSKTLLRRVTVPRPKIDISLEPIDKTSNGGPMDFYLTIAPEKPVEEIEIKLRVSDNITYDGKTEWIEEAKGRREFVYPLHGNIPRNDTSYVTIQVVARNPLMLAKPIYTIVTTGDTLEVFIRRPGNIPSPPQPKTNDPIRDTLTQEQLQTEYMVRLDLRDSSDLRIAEKILGPLSDSAKSKDREGFYTLKSTLENLIKLADEGIEFGFTTPPPWDPKYSPSRDSVPDKQSEKDSLKKQGALNKKLSPTSPDGISLDSVVGMTTPGELPTGQEITFRLRLNNNTGYNIIGSTNGFRIYSPDGAQWAPITWDTTSVGWGNMYESFFFSDFGVTGSGADTIGFGGFKIFKPGIPNGFDEVVFLISTQVDGVYDGYTLCLDSSWYPPVNNWLWSLSTSPSQYYPSWDGPHCFTIQQEDSITFTGHLYYLDPVPPDTNQKPMRDVRIEMWDDDQWPNPDDWLGTAVTGNNGHFSFLPVENEDESGTLDVFFRIFAENEAGYVTESPSSDIYKIQTPNWDNIPSGAYDTIIVADLSQSGFFFVLDHVLSGYDIWTSQTGEIPDSVHCMVSPNYDTGYDTLAKRLDINSLDYYQDWYPDQFDEWVVLHEYGHHLEYTFDFFDAGDLIEIGWADKFTTEVAAREGWAEFWAAFCLDNEFLRNYAMDVDGQYTFYAYHNCENGEYGTITPIDTSAQSANNYGKRCAGAVAGIFWDIFDDVPDDYDSFGDTTFPRQPSDSIGDTLSNGIDTILIALLDRSYVHGHNPDNIDEFWQAWFRPYYAYGLGHYQAIRDIWYEHGEILICCVGDRGNADYDRGDNTNVADLTYLVDYVFRGGPVPPCWEEANVNGDAGENVNVADLTYLVDYLFRGGPLPPNCP